MRSLIIRDFTPKVVEQIKPRIQETVDSLLDAVQASGEMDVVSQFASPLPVSIIAQILGVPEPDRHFFRKWADAILSFQGVNKPGLDDLLRAQSAIVEMRPYIRQMIEERRRQPREDLISKFLAAESGGGRISEPELISSCGTFIVAGHETTIALISNAICTLLTHPDQLALLRANPELITSAVEETLRYESPIPRQPRIMKGDVEFRGKQFRQGEVVFQMLSAANRDPAYFSEPDKFDIGEKIIGTWHSGREFISASVRCSHGRKR